MLPSALTAFCHNNLDKGIYVEFEALVKDPDYFINTIGAKLGFNHYSKLDLKQYIRQPEFTQKQVTA